jgi:hypothetical protein
VDWNVLLLDLPVDLLLKIIALTRPDCFENLVLTCHAIYDLAVSSRLVAEQYESKRRWQTWDAHYANDPPYLEHQQFHPLQLISAIQRQPVIANYVKNAKFSGWFDACEEVARAHETLKQELKDSGALMEMLEESVYLKEAGQDAMTWHAAIIDEGKAQYAYVFWLTLLTGVTHLRLSYEWAHGS